MNKGEVRPQEDISRFREIFEALPRLGSPEYLEYLEAAAATALPAQVLVRAYRQLALAGMDDAAKSTLARLLGQEDRHGYLTPIRLFARDLLARGYYSFDEKDLLYATVAEMIKVLHTPRGAMAETAWVTFCRQRLVDAWRQFAGRRGERIRADRIEPSKDRDSGEMIDPLDEIDESRVLLPVRVRESKLPWLEGFIREMVAKIDHPLTRAVAEDQFGDDPSPISSGTSESGKPPLTKQLGVSRFSINRALNNARARLAAALLASKDHDLDLEWLEKLFPGRR
jgi:hypothetical protein